jgi:Abortive infection C-terminus
MNPPSKGTRHRAPLNDAIIVAVAELVDDAQSERREPSHSDIEFEIARARLSPGDPKSQGLTVGKAKRVRATLSWALEHSPDEAEVLVAGLIALIRAKGGFRTDSPNFVGQDQITDATNAFAEEGYILSADGELQPTSIDTLSGIQLTDALEAYVRRARRGSEDAALLVGTGKDLLEATAAHIIAERYSTYSQQANFPTLLGQAFTALDLATPQTPPLQGEPPQRKLQRALYEAGCSVNSLRNKQGTGHGRPWIPSISDTEARAAVQIIGIVAGFLLAAHKEKP